MSPQYTELALHYYNISLALSLVAVYLTLQVIGDLFVRIIFEHIRLVFLDNRHEG